MGADVSLYDGDENMSKQRDDDGGLKDLESAGVVRRCPRCDSPTEHGGGCPRMICYVCGERWNWGDLTHWGGEQLKKLTPEEAKESFESFMVAERVDKLVTYVLISFFLLMCLLGDHI